MLKWIACALALAAAFGCVPPRPVPPPREITCDSKESCDIMWGRALDWVLQNSAWKIETQTDLLIETYNSIGGSPRAGFRVSRVPLGGGRFALRFAAGCDNAFACIPSVDDLRVSFEDSLLGPAPGVQPAALK